MDEIRGTIRDIVRQADVCIIYVGWQALVCVVSLEDAYLGNWSWSFQSRGIEGEPDNGWAIRWTSVYLPDGTRRRKKV